MIRYCKQRERITCGPVAMLNILKHFGHKYSYEAVPVLKEFLKTHSRGTNLADIDAALQDFAAWDVNKFYPSLTNIRKQLKKDRVVLVVYAQHVKAAWSGHVCLIVEDTELGFKVINDLKKTVSYQSDRVFRSCTRARCLGRTRFPVAWAINEKENRSSDRGASTAPTLQQQCVRRESSNNRRTSSKGKNSRRRSKAS